MSYTFPRCFMKPRVYWCQATQCQTSISINRLLHRIVPNTNFYPSDKSLDVIGNVFGFGNPQWQIEIFAKASYEIRFATENAHFANIYFPCIKQDTRKYSKNKQITTLQSQATSLNNIVMAISANIYSQRVLTFSLRRSNVNFI